MLTVYWNSQGKQILLLISSTVTAYGCDITAAWISLTLAKSATTFPDMRIEEGQPLAGYTAIP
jgi:hypothetical protein